MIFDNATLPSRTVPYQVKLVDVNPFRPKQLGLLGKAVYLESMQPAIDAMQEVCNVDVNLLTPGDFYFLLAWQRFHCLKREVTANWECSGTKYIREDTREVYKTQRVIRVTENWKAAEGTAEQAQLENPADLRFDLEYCGQHNLAPLTFADFNIVFLPEVELDPRLDYPRVMTMVEYDSMITDPVYHKLVGPARWIAEGRTLKDKIEILYEQSDMSLLEAAADANANIAHGIGRQVGKECSVCGSKHYFSTSIEPASFFV